MTEEAERMNAELIALEDEINPLSAEIDAGLAKIREDSVSRQMTIDEMVKFRDELQEKIGERTQLWTKWNALYAEFTATL